MHTLLGIAIHSMSSCSHQNHQIFRPAIQLQLFHYLFLVHSLTINNTRQCSKQNREAMCHLVLIYQRYPIYILVWFETVLKAFPIQVASIPEHEHCKCYVIDESLGYRNVKARACLRMLHRKLLKLFKICYRILVSCSQKLWTMSFHNASQVCLFGINASLQREPIHYYTEELVLDF